MPGPSSQESLETFVSYYKYDHSYRYTSTARTEVRAESVANTTVACSTCTEYRTLEIRYAYSELGKAVQPVLYTPQGKLTL